ncbi:MAG: sigma 54-interacting transcriptional regulator [Polyangiaceae bacterium]|nr:sigma 54-interacting transcriptional regulator [Polyangiaceae bacterium]
MTAGGGAPRGLATHECGLLLLWAERHAELPTAWPLPQRALVVGRESPADLVLPVHAVSRRHAELAPRGGRWWVRDLGSTNGTLVEGRRIAEAELEDGAELRIGDALLLFTTHDVLEHARYRLDGSTAPGERRLVADPGALVGGLAMDRIAEDVDRVARAGLNVLVLGESGTGKEVVAGELHRRSRRKGMLSAVNCAAIPANLLESELFGYKRGAFSGADRDKPGLIRSAHEGTLLLDEIGDMPAEAQAKLLRVIQSREVWPVGATSPERVDVRIVAATHRDLDAMMRAGSFRQDLYARLAEHTIRLPPLRERKRDLYVLLRAFLERHGGERLVPSFEFMLGLVEYDWPYNVRELEACVKRAVALAQGPTLGRELLPPQVIDHLAGYGELAAPPSRRLEPERAPDSPAPRPVTPSREELVRLLQHHHGNVAAVGREYGKARMQVHRWLKLHGLEADSFRAPGGDG